MATRYFNIPLDDYCKIVSIFVRLGFDINKLVFKSNYYDLKYILKRKKSMLLKSERNSLSSLVEGSKDIIYLLLDDVYPIFNELYEHVKDFEIKEDDIKNPPTFLCKFNILNNGDYELHKTYSLLENRSDYGNFCYQCLGDSAVESIANLSLTSSDNLVCSVKLGSLGIPLYGNLGYMSSNTFEEFCTALDRLNSLTQGIALQLKAQKSKEYLGSCISSEVIVGYK
jgi:hypothetical protein